MVPRLFAPLARDGDTTVALADDEQHYARHVLRLAVGDAVRVFNGRGLEWSGNVALVSRTSLSLTLGPGSPPVPEPLVAVTLGIAVLKADYMDEAIRNAAMIGVARIQPLVTSRAMTSRLAAAGTALERWRRVALASIRQSGRAVVPPIETPAGFDSWLATAASATDARLILCEPRLTERRAVDLHAMRDRARQHGVVLLVGPEGGWGDSELASARAAGFVPWTVSPRILRADAVAVAALSVLFYAWDQDA